jgi:hypothetical protein
MGLLGSSQAAPPPAADPAGLAGVYECHGMGADGRAYRGAVIIQPDGDRFFLQWIIAAQRSAVGLGIRNGDSLAVSFFSADAGGVVLYRIEGERLIGHWSAPLTDGRVFEETLTRMADVAPPSAPSNQPGSRKPRLRPSGPLRPALWGAVVG